MEVMQELLDDGRFPLSEKDKSGKTVLHCGAAAGHLAMCRLILKESPAQLGMKDERRETALHLACANGHVGVARMLIVRGAAVSDANHKGENPLHIACSGDDEVTTANPPAPLPALPNELSLWTVPGMAPRVVPMQSR